MDDRAPIAAAVGQSVTDRGVGVKRGNFRQRGDAGGGGAMEFRGVGDKAGVAGAGNDGFGHPHLGQIEIQKVAIGIQREAPITA